MEEVRQSLIVALRGGQAFDPIDTILSEVPEGRRYERPEGMEQSAWQILDHMRRTLEDLYAYSTHLNGQYRELDWPDDYWSSSSGEGDDWDRSLAGFRDVQARLEGLLAEGDLIAPFAWEPTHNLLREALLAIEHNAYHAGELVELTRSLR